MHSESLKKLSQFNASDQVKIVATDVDGTLTRHGRFSADLLAAFESLGHAGIAVVLSTGRSAGWVHGLASYLPVRGALAENGGVFFSSDGERPPLLLGHEGPSDPERGALRAMFHVLKNHIPHLHPTADNAFRMSDWTFSVEGVSATELALCGELCLAHGLEFTYSTIHGHIMRKGQNKGDGLLKVIGTVEDLRCAPEEVVTVGDSPNDEALFDRARFAHSVGVANIARYQDRLRHLPRYLAEGDEVEGFLELARLLVSARRP